MTWLIPILKVSIIGGFFGAIALYVAGGIVAIIRPKLGIWLIRISIGLCGLVVAGVILAILVLVLHW